MVKTAEVETTINLAGLPREINEALANFIAQIEDRETPLNKPPQHRINPIAYGLDLVSDFINKTGRSAA